jgi:DNA-binding MarR family transcriptional regulator
MEQVAEEVTMSSPVDAEAIERLRLALGRITRRIDRQVMGEGLTRTQLSVLASVAMHGPLGLGELAELEGVNPTMLSRVVAKLEDGALIRRQVDPDDRRAARVEITDAGALLRSRLNARRVQLLTERLAGLPEGFAAQLVAALPALEALAEQMASGPAAGASRGSVPTL